MRNFFMVISFNYLSSMSLSLMSLLFRSLLILTIAMVLSLVVKSSFGETSPPTQSANTNISCDDSLQLDINKVVLSEASLSLRKHHEALSRTLRGDVISYVQQLVFRGYESWSPDKEILQNIFGIKFGNQAHLPSILTIMNNYKGHMLSLVDQGKVSSKDILLPAFFIELEGKTQIVLSPDDIPEGGIIISELSNDQFNGMLAQGYFPLSETLLIHDLSHLSAFVENLEYMAGLRRLARSDFEVGFQSYPSRELRLFSVHENLILVRPEKKQEMLEALDISDQMREHLESITLPEMIEHLSQRSEMEIMDRVRYLKSNFHNFLNPLGGAARDSYSSYHEETSNINPILRMLTNFKWPMHGDNTSVIRLARIQTILIRLSLVNLEDWLEAVNTPFLSSRSPLGYLFADPQLWVEYPSMYRIFSSPYYSSKF